MTIKSDQPNSASDAGDPDVNPTILELVQWHAGDRHQAQALLHPLKSLVDLTRQANARMNLTADAEPRLFWERHIEDALWAGRRIAEARGRPGAGVRIADVGSGGGIPGLVWAILWPEARVDLLEARRKRAEFLRQAIESLNLKNARTIEGRAEVLGRQVDEVDKVDKVDGGNEMVGADLALREAHREAYDLVTARALAPLPTLLELTLPLAKVGGAVAAIKSVPLAEELAQAAQALSVLGAAGQPPALLGYARSDGKRCMVCLISKRSPTPARYPRRPNLPERRPLG